MSNVRAPQFLVDLVSDLRDRRLLLPAGLLALAVVAVPLLLSSSTEPPPPAPASPAAATLDAGAATQSAVLAESVTVRDYRKRLNELKGTNPFESSFKVPSSVADDAAGLDDLAATGGGGALGGAGGSTAGISTDSGAAPSAATTSSSTSTGSSGASSSGSGGGSSQPEFRYFTREIDVKVGEVGDLSARNGVEQLTFLPKDAKPVLVFLGTSSDGKKAVFLVSNDVASTSGEGACIPSTANCDYLTMREGDAQTFDYTPDGKTYKLVLKEIQTVRLSKAPDTSP